MDEYRRDMPKDEEYDPKVIFDFPPIIEEIEYDPQKDSFDFPLTEEELEKEAKDVPLGMDAKMDEWSKAHDGEESVKQDKGEAVGRDKTVKEKAPDPLEGLDGREANIILGGGIFLNDDSEPEIKTDEYTGDMPKDEEYDPQRDISQFPPIIEEIEYDPQKNSFDFPLTEEEIEKEAKDVPVGMDAMMDEWRKAHDGEESVKQNEGKAAGRDKTGKEKAPDPLERLDGGEANIILGAEDNTIAEQRRSILECARMLEKAKTLINSDEYKNLITVMKTVGSNNSGGLDGLSGSRKFAHELYGIHLATERYLNHKAADGVKKNSFNKLLAVEKANRVLADIIEKSPDKELMQPRGSSRPRSLSELNITLEQRQRNLRSRRGEYADIPKKLEGHYVRALTIKERAPELKNVKTEFLQDCLEDVDSCMCKIMIKAQLKGNTAAYHSLDDMRRRLTSEPFELKIKKTTEVSKSNSKGKAI